MSFSAYDKISHPHDDETVILFLLFAIKLIFNKEQGIFLFPLGIPKREEEGKKKKKKVM